MALSLSALMQECRNLLGDLDSLSYHFTDLQITDWINQAIRDLSIHFPRFLAWDISTLAGNRIYDLDSTFTGVISVEFPAGQDPPIFLKRRPYTHPRFWIEDGYYDFVKPSDAHSLNPPQLYISRKPAALELITIKLSMAHNQLYDPWDTTTIQERHLHLISLFVRWKAWQELTITEGMNPGPLSTLTFTMEQNSARAERSYRASLEAALSAETESVVLPWKMDRFDRSY